MRIALHFLLFMFLYVHSIGQITLSVQTTPSTCQNNGSITVNATGGSGSYTYTLASGPVGVSLPLAVGNVFNGLPSGSYTVQVSDNAGNTNTMNATVSGNYTNPIISTVVSAPSSGNMVYGTALVTVQNGTGLPPFQYASAPVGSPAPNSTAYQSANLITCIPTGSHNIYVKDACGNVNVHTTYVEGAAMNYYIDCYLAPLGDSVTLYISNYNEYPDGIGPFTYQIGTGTSSISGTLPTTGNTSIQSTRTSITDSITVTNACGQSQTQNIECLVICFLDSNLPRGFKGIAQEKGNLLSWETANENNNKGFYLQRSYHLPEWETLPALIKGKNQATNEYDTLDVDFNRQMNKIYYRLLQEDIDGKITYSDYISLWSIASDNILIYPNPASNTIFIENAMQEELDGIVVYNESGEEVLYHENITGSNKISASIKDLTAGIYFMKISINGKKSFHKFVKED